MEIITIGLDCKRAPLEVRERLSFPAERLEEAFNKLAKLPFAGETAILSTCNRVELYVVSGHRTQNDTQAELRGFLSRFHGVEESDFAPYLFYLGGRAAVRHLFEVACGLQSMVLGEPQIQGQVREALELARQYGGTGGVLDALFRAALTTGKRARTETGISENGVSVSYTAIELLEEKVGPLIGRSALVVGSGKTGRLTGQILLDRKVGQLTLINRNLEHALETANQLKPAGARVRSFDDLVPALAESDLVISCTSAPHTVIGCQHLVEATRNRNLTRPIYMVDLAVPRDIEPEVSRVAGTRIWDIDDIKVLADANMARRGREVEAVCHIVEQEVDTFMSWLGTLAIVPTITTLRRQAEAVRQAELARARQSLGELSDRDARLLDELTARIVNKLLHEPTLRLKEAAGGSDALRYAEVVRYLFGLPGDEHD